MPLSGEYEQTDGRRCFRPSIPVAPDATAVADMLAAASGALMDFDTALTGFPVPAVLPKLFARLDAVHSSGAEGSTTTLTDLLEYQSSLRSAPDRADAETVAACADAFADLAVTANDPVAATLAVHARLFAGAHDRMVASTAGRLKAMPNGVMDRDEPGGIFTYTSPASLRAALSEWRDLTVGRDPGIPELVRQGMSHWMFAHIHPVADGNGRIGRLLVPLMLQRSGFTRTACAFLGEAVHEDKDLYVDALKTSRRTGSQVPWLRVFLSLVARNARANLERLEALAAIRSDWESWFDGFPPDSVVHRLAPWILTTPAFTAKDAAAAMGCTHPEANEALGMLVDLGVLSLPNGTRRDRLFHADRVLDLFDRSRLAPGEAPALRQAPELARRGGP